MKVTPNFRDVTTVAELQAGAARMMTSKSPLPFGMFVPADYYSAAALESVPTANVQNLQKVIATR